MKAKSDIPLREGVKITITEDRNADEILFNLYNKLAVMSSHINAAIIFSSNHSSGPKWPDELDWSDEMLEAKEYLENLKPVDEKSRKTSN